jgi:hypothetical protein
MVEEIDVTPVSECVTNKSQRKAWGSRSPMVFSSKELMHPLVVWSFPVIDGDCSRCWSAVDAFSVGVNNVGDVRDGRAQGPVAVNDPGGCEWRVVGTCSKVVVFGK